MTGYTVKTVDYRDRTLCTYTLNRCTRDLAAMAEARAIVHRWNEGCHDDDGRAEGFYVWDAAGRMVGYA